MSYGLDLGSSLWLFGRLAVEISRGEDQFGALTGMRGFLVDGRLNVYAGASLGLLPVAGEAFAVGPQLGARFIFAGGLFLGAQLEAFVLPFAEDEGELELLFTGGAQLGFFLD